MKAGPTLLQGSNLGGLDVSGSWWFAKHWGVEGSGRAPTQAPAARVSTTTLSLTAAQLKEPFVAHEYMFVAGPGKWLGPHNKQHGALIAHAMVLRRHVWRLREGPCWEIRLLRWILPYNNQVAPAAIIGGHMDLNRSAHWVFRITPDAVMTHYGINYPPNNKQFDVNFALSVGVEYKFKKKR